MPGVVASLWADSSAACTVAMSAASVAEIGTGCCAGPVGRCEGSVTTVTTVAAHAAARSAPHRLAARGTTLLTLLLQATGPVTGSRRAGYCPARRAPGRSTPQRLRNVVDGLAQHDGRGHHRRAGAAA